jgi:hypothetical protein
MATGVLPVLLLYGLVGSLFLLVDEGPPHGLPIGEPLNRPPNAH